MKLQTLTSPLLQNLQPMLNESIYHFLLEHQTGRTDFSELASIFSRLIQSMSQPPLEFIWFYSALTFHTAKSSLSASSNYILTVKDLFNCLTSFRSPTDFSYCSYLKHVSLVAPVLYCLVKFKFEIRKFKTEVEFLVDGLVSHIVMCCNNELVEEKGHADAEVGKSVGSWVGVVPVWIAEQVGENRGRVDGLELFFPLSNGEIRCGIDGYCGMDSLAGIVMIEVFLFRLCLLFDSGGSRIELHMKVKTCAAQIIKGFRKNSTFLVMLLKLLLEPSLPVGELLAAPDELLLRQLFFDVALDLGSFLSCDTSPRLSDAQYKEIVILWLFVTNTALQFASENGDHSRVECYINAFSGSKLPHQIISWVTGETSRKPTAPDISSPEDIIGWLLVLEQQGLKICNLSISELHEKALKYKSMGINNEVKDSQTMIEYEPLKLNGRRKRDNAGFGEVQQQIKVLKCCHENDDSYRGKNEAGNPVADQEMVDMVW